MKLELLNPSTYLPWIESWPFWAQAILRALLLVVPILLLVPTFIWLERRLLSWMQDRIGPNRVGPFGLLQPIADGVKLFFKEDITPSAIDGFIYFIAPAVALFPAFALGGTMPWGPITTLTPVADVNVGVLYIMAVSSLGVYGIVLGGYASNNKYSLLGGLRASAQLISYELAMGMALASVVLYTGSLKLTEIVKLQTEAFTPLPMLTNWNIFSPFGMVSGIIFLICMVAETNRAPFDLPEAENELIAGYHTEYSSMKFAVFFMGEYAAMFVYSGIFSCLFLGGYNLLPFHADWAQRVNDLGAPIWFIGKCYFGVVVYIWLRATLPRLRYDQLMRLGWHNLLPMAVLNFVLVAMGIMIGGNTTPLIGWLSVAGAWVIIGGLWLLLKRPKKAGDMLETRTIRMVGGGARTVKMVEDSEKAGVS